MVTRAPSSMIESPCSKLSSPSAFTSFSTSDESIAISEVPSNLIRHYLAVEVLGGHRYIWKLLEATCGATDVHCGVDFGRGWGVVSAAWKRAHV